MTSIKQWWNGLTPAASFPRWLSVGLMWELIGVVVLVALLMAGALFLLLATSPQVVLARFAEIEAAVINLVAAFWLIAKYS